MLVNNTHYSKYLLIFILSILFLFQFQSTVNAQPSLGQWQNTTSLPFKIGSSISFILNNELFNLSGSAATGQSKYDIINSTINNADGTVGLWGNNTNFPRALIWHTIALNNNHVYILGGREENPGSSNQSIPDVYLNINSSFPFSWQSLAPLPKRLSMGASVVYNNKLYYAGGFTDSGSNLNQSVYVAQINPDNTIGNWSQAGMLPTAMSGFGMVAANNHLIIVGGGNEAGTFFSKTYTAQINSDGIISNWTETSTLPEGAYRSSVVKVNNQLFSIGGWNGTSYNRVYVAQINSDGTLGNWQLSSPLPKDACCGTAASNGTYIYQIGGYSNSLGQYLDDVFVSKINKDTTLAVPYFNQNDSPWGQQEYDHAKSLGFTNYLFERWGCFVTSAAMVLNYHGMTTMFDNSALMPETLNNWLNRSDVNGYATGKDEKGQSYSYIYPQKISELSKKLYNANKSSVKLEYQLITGANKNSQLTNDIIINGNPDIIKVANSQTSSHFVVAKGKTDTTYLINDPEWNYSDLTQFNNTFSELHRYIPSHTDLSYLIFVINPDSDILVTDSQNRRSGKIYQNNSEAAYDEIPDATFTYEDPINNSNESLGTGANVFQIPKPAEGSYTIQITSKDPHYYTLNSLTYTTEGTPSATVNNGTSSQTVDMYTIPYSQTQTASPTRAITFDSTLNDITQLYKTHQISVKVIYTIIYDTVNLAKKQDQNKNTKAAKTTLKLLETTLTLYKGKGITAEASSLILLDIQTLEQKYK